MSLRLSSPSETKIFGYLAGRCDRKRQNVLKWLSTKFSIRDQRRKLPQIRTNHEVLHFYLSHIVPPAVTIVVAPHIGSGVLEGSIAVFLKIYSLSRFRNNFRYRPQGISEAEPQVSCFAKFAGDRRVYMILVSKNFSIEPNIVPHRNPLLRCINFGEMSIGTALKILKNERAKEWGVNVWWRSERGFNYGFSCPAIIAQIRPSEGCSFGEVTI
jgi:hypothetical protein